MKITLLFLSIFLTSFSCESVQLDEEIKEVAFRSMGMSGHAETITVNRDSVVLSYEKRRTQEKPLTFGRKLDNGEWTSLIAIIKAINFSEISSLESPTNKRAYDGALHSEIIIRTRDREYVSPSFDDEDPHEKLQPLMNALRELANTVDRTK